MSFRIFLRSFISALIVSVLFSAPSLTEMNVYREIIFPNFRSFSGVKFRTPTRSLCCRRKLLALERNAFSASGERFSAGGERIQSASSNFSPNPPPPLPIHTRLATSDFQTKLISRWLLIARAHLQKRAVAIKLLCSPYATPTYIVIHAIAEGVVHVGGRSRRRKWPKALFHPRAHGCLLRGEMLP